MDNMFSTMGQLLNGNQLTVTRERQLTVSANCDYVVGLLTGNSTMDIAARVTLLLPCSV